MNRRQPIQFQRTGLTLIDVVMTVMIIGIMAAIAAPKFTTFYHRERLRSAAQRVITDVNAVRSWAMTNSKTCGIIFSTSFNDYKTGAEGPPDINHPGQTLETSLDDTPYYSNISVVDFNGTNELTFNGTGIPQHGGALVITNGSDSMTVSVNPVTGLVTAD